MDEHDGWTCSANANMQNRPVGFDFLRAEARREVERVGECGEWQ
jgi:hypothetical protein